MNDTPSFPFGDQTTAAALHIAKADLDRLGWKYSAKDIGERARIILDAMSANRSHPNAD